MDHACPNVRTEVKSILGKEGRDDALVAIILASAAELKRMPALRVRGRGVIVEKPGDNELIIENVPSSWCIKRLREEFAKLVPELDDEKDYSGRLAICPFLRLASGAAAACTRAVYNGPVTQTLLSHIRGESVMSAESLAHGLFFRPPIAGEPFIWIKSTPQFRALLKVLVSSEYTKTEIEMLLKQAVDNTAAKYGLPPSVDVRLYETRFGSNKQNPNIIGLCAVGVENHGIGRVICPDGKYCAALMRQISTVPVSVSIARDINSAASDIEILRVSMALSARRKRHRRKKASGSNDGSGKDDDHGGAPDDSNESRSKEDMNCHEAEGLEGGEESGAAGDDGHDDGKSSSGNGSGTERCTVPPPRTLRRGS
jgi:hypothetical protein